MQAIFFLFFYPIFVAFFSLLGGVFLLFNPQDNKASNFSFVQNKSALFYNNENQGSQYIKKAHLPLETYLPTPVLIVNNFNFSLNAESGVVIDAGTKDVLYNKNADSRQSIASITKIMSAMVFLDYHVDLDNIYEMQNIDRRDGGRIYVFTGEKLKIRDLLNLALVASDNTAIIALVHAAEMDVKSFVEAMNKKARTLGLTNTNFVDPAGLREDNISTARDVAKLLSAALMDKNISRTVLRDSYTFATIDGRQVSIESTDDLLNDPTSDIQLLGGKTGYLEAAGYCFASKLADAQGREIISVVLGAKNKSARFEETKKMARWVYSVYEWY